MTENRYNSNNLLKGLFFPLTFIFPLILSMGVCSKIGAFGACVAAIALSLFVDKYNSKNLMPVLFCFTVIAFLFTTFGYLSVVISLVISGIVQCFGKIISVKLTKISNSPIGTGAMLATAIAVTVLQTNNYFAIGASGNTVKEMIESYVSLGFHGNWRGVLYGTIVMVILITFPRKFKSFCKIIHPSFTAIIVTLFLNYFLNPPDLITSINEIKILAPNTDINLSITVIGVIASIICGLTLGLSELHIISESSCESDDYIKCGIINIILSPLMCFVPQKINKDFYKNIPFAALLGLIIYLSKDIIIRIPVHSCAVIIIVAAWQAVRWTDIKNAFKAPISVLMFMIPFIFLVI